MRDEMNKALDEVEFTIFDTETTGLEPGSGDRIVEIAAIRFRGKETVSTFQTLVNPNRQVSEGAFRVNHITREMLESAPAIEAVLPDFLNFIKGSCLCSYNAPFDMEFLENELKLANVSPPAGLVVVDILSMARKLLPGLPRYALWSVAQKLGAACEQRHRAFADVEMSLDVFRKLGDIMRLKRIIDYKGLVVLFGLDSPFLQDITSQKIAQIQEAIDLGVKIRIQYFSSSGAQVSEREVAPKAIKLDNNKAYLVGYCCLKHEERTFRIDGILHLEII